jgi:hypothetical protein
MMGSVKIVDRIDQYSVVLRMKEFLPRLEILPAAQRRLWSEFSGVPEEFVLYRGTAVALHLGHRHSIDFDFFGNRALHLSVLETGIPSVQRLFSAKGTL